jgi:hypothetical protein
MVQMDESATSEFNNIKQLVLNSTAYYEFTVTGCRRRVKGVLVGSLSPRLLCVMPSNSHSDHWLGYIAQLSAELTLSCWSNLKQDIRS